MLGPRATFRRIKFWRHLLVAYISKYKLRVITTIITIGLLAIASAKIEPQVIHSNVISIGYVGNYQLENLPSDVLIPATGSLLTADKSGRPIPSLASNWTITDDGKTYIVYLRDNLRWHDSTTVVASSISIAIKNVQINALNNKTLEFKLPNPIASFPQTLD